MKSKSTTTEKTVWKCTQCAKDFRYESDMRRHELGHVPQFECDRCGKKFSYLSALRRHEKTHERSGSVQCNQCGRNFRDEVLLKRHVRYSHKGTYKCVKCTATFSSEPALSTHMKTHKPESERRFRCSFGCGKSFNFSHHLKHHEMTHTNTKQHFCQTCGKGFIQFHHLKTHEKSHESTYRLPCTVSDCKKKFGDEYARKRHMATHRKTYDVGSSPDSSVNPLKISPSEENQDGDWHVSRQKSIGNLSGRNAEVECKSMQEQEILNLKTEILNPSFINDRKDSQNNTRIKNNVHTRRENDRNECENDSVDNNFNTCKTAIGGCLVTGDSKIDENCLCAQITNPIGEIDEEFALASNNDTQDVKPIDIIEIRKRHQATHNRKLRPSQQKIISIQSSGRHIIIECKPTQKQKTAKIKMLNPLFIHYDHEDSQNNNNKKENDVAYGKDNRVECENNSLVVSDSNNACKTDVTNCLVTEDDSSNCVKISYPNETEKTEVASKNETLALNQIVTVRDTNVEVIKLNSNVTLQKDYGINNYDVSSKCEGCECANWCSVSDKIACNKSVPNIEYIHGGIVKLRDTFDIDFQASAKENGTKDVTDEIHSQISDCKSSNFKSCRDVIGNCIVSGNSTIGEGCLCAKMMVDDQVMEEEIDEITPCPQGR